jgi:histidine triad (HIT) family protein
LAKNQRLRDSKGRFVKKIKENKEMPIKDKILFEDARVSVILSPEPASPGHTLVIPKENKIIMEQMDDELLGYCFSVANKVSMFLFEKLKAEGTNIIVQNGLAAGQTEPHFIIHIIPRKENDGINLQWKTKQASDSELSDAAMQLGNGLIEKKEKPVEIVKEEIPIVKDEKAAEIVRDNYMIKQLRRIP